MQCHLTEMAKSTSHTTTSSSSYTDTESSISAGNYDPSESLRIHLTLILLVVMLRYSGQQPERWAWQIWTEDWKRHMKDNLTRDILLETFLLYLEPTNAPWYSLHFWHVLPLEFERFPYSKMTGKTISVRKATKSNLALLLTFDLMVMAVHDAWYLFTAQNHATPPPQTEVEWADSVQVDPNENMYIVMYS